ncbi:MAG: helix-turn-helix domain-containing protein [Isosphaeraceae bacterium]
MTQQALADAVGVTRQTIIALEAGKYVPRCCSRFGRGSSARESRTSSSTTLRRDDATAHRSNPPSWAPECSSWVSNASVEGRGPRRQGARRSEYRSRGSPHSPA